MKATKPEEMDVVELAQNVFGWSVHLQLRLNEGGRIASDRQSRRLVMLLEMLTFELRPDIGFPPRNAPPAGHA